MQCYHLYTDIYSRCANIDQVLFINQSGSTLLDKFFENHLQQVNDLFAKHEKKFVFLPAVFKDNNIVELVRYNLPMVSPPEAYIKLMRSPLSQIYGLFQRRSCTWAYRIQVKNAPFSLKDDPDSEKTPSPFTGLVFANTRVNNILPNTTLYNFTPLVDGADEDIWCQLSEWEELFFPTPKQLTRDDFETDEEYNNWKWSHTPIPPIKANSIMSYGDTADDQFPIEAYQLSQEVRERVEKLRLMGVNELIIKGLFYDQPTLSRMVITRDWRILLPDYQNREIVMTPLVKAVYILFLNHPEGILFKEIGNWKWELLELYERVSGREADNEMRASVAAICNPLNNSINEKCSRIREAFLREFTDTIACNYYITGDRATPKGIRLERNLLRFEGGREQSFVCPF